MTKQLASALTLSLAMGCASQAATRPSVSAREAHACHELPASAPGVADGLVVVASSPITERTGKQMVTRTRGARLVVRAEPAMTKPWLERVVACRIAGYDELRAQGRSADGLQSDPFAVSGVSAQVVPVHGAFAIELTSDEPSAARELVARAQRSSL